MFIFCGEIIVKGLLAAILCGTNPGLYNELTNQDCQVVGASTAPEVQAAPTPTTQVEKAQAS